MALSRSSDVRVHLFTLAAANAAIWAWRAAHHNCRSADVARAAQLVWLTFGRSMLEWMTTAA